MTSVFRITLDSNCIINLFDDQSQMQASRAALRTLIRYALSGRAEISITTRVEADLLKDKEPQRRSEMLRTLELFPVAATITIQVDSEPSRRLLRQREEIQQIAFPGLTEADRRYSNKTNDIDHLLGHALNGRDVFVTDDHHDILRRREELKRGLGIVVMSPEQCLSYLESIELRQAPRTFPTDGINPAYHSIAMKGRVQFDYSNNNHRYAIGSGHFFFETTWSKASDESIYALSDASSISALALAKGIREISDISDIAVFDFSSRSRTPDIGQIVVWRNVNGIYAATKIIGIKDDSRGDSEDELVFDYVIFPEGSADFTRS